MASLLPYYTDSNEPTHLSQPPWWVASGCSAPGVICTAFFYVASYWFMMCICELVNVVQCCGGPLIP